MKEFPKAQHKRPQLAKLSIFRAVLCAASCIIPATRETKSHFAPFAVLLSLAYASGLNPIIYFSLASCIRDSVPAGANNLLPTTPYLHPQNSQKTLPNRQPLLSLNTDQPIEKTFFPQPARRNEALSLQILPFSNELFSTFFIFL